MMIRTVASVLAAIVSLAASVAQAAEPDPRRGAAIYRACVACHALEPGLHLSGPSLAGMWNRAAGRAAGFNRYSKGLRDADFSWNEAALNGWLKKPSDMISDTIMAFDGIADDAARADLVASLKIVGVPGGGQKAVRNGLIPENYLTALAPEPLGNLPAEARVTAVRDCGDAYFIATADGRERPLWEKNVRLKIDSVASGPPKGTSVLIPSGMRGDRFSLVFASLADLTEMLTEECQ